MRRDGERLGHVSDCWRWIACESCGKTGSLVMQRDLEAGCCLTVQKHVS